MLLELLAIDMALAITASIRLVLPAFRMAEKTLKKKFSILHKLGHLLVFNIGSLLFFPFIAYLIIFGGETAVRGYSNSIVEDAKK